MYFTLFVTVLITAAFLVVAAYAIAKWIGPRSYNPAKGEPYECGIPTYGTSWLPVHIGYYLFAILFLMFDVETVFLYPWAVVVKTFGTLALATIGFFMSFHSSYGRDLIFGFLISIQVLLSAKHTQGQIPIPA